MAGEATNNDVRAEMSQYWQEHSQQATMETMMLDSSASTMSVEEIPEMLEMLPSELATGRILELAAGIGRYTGLLAERASSVHAVEFMDSFLVKNRESHESLGNVTFELQDVTQLEREPESCDALFSCWLLMYLSDSEVTALMENALRWLPVGGAAVIRESCFRQSGDGQRSFNPTKYRTSQDYTNLFRAVRVVDGDQQYRFEIERSRCITVYVREKGNPGQVCWTLRKVAEPAAESQLSFQQFLDQSQYTRNGVLRYEKIFGAGYVSTGGPDTTRQYVAMLDLQPGQTVLDVGCGIGGGDFYMADEFNVWVKGIDLSSNMVNIALERAHGCKNSRVQFEIADATTVDFGEGVFDVIYSRDTILHIEDKLSLFQSFYRMLKPGGKLLITDYCGLEEGRSEAFSAYVAQRGYHLLTPEHYGQVIEQAGFETVQATNNTDAFVEVLQRELERTTANSEEFIAEFTQADYDAIVNGWQDKVERCASGNQMWGLFYAEKAVAAPPAPAASE